MTTTTRTPLQRMHHVCQAVGADLTRSELTDAGRARGEATLTRGEREYSLHLMHDPRYPEQGLTPRLYRVHNGAPYLTTLVSLAYADDDLAASIVRRAITHDQRQG